MGEQRADPVGGPASLGLVVDVAQRLAGETAAIAMFALRPQAMMAAAHRQHGGTGRKAPGAAGGARARIATTLHGGPRPPHRPSRPGSAPHPPTTAPHAVGRDPDRA